MEVVSKQRSGPTPAAKDSLINEWLTRFALNAGVALGEKERAVCLTMWKEDFADVEASRLQAAFVACLRSHTYKTMPRIGDVRQHLSKAEESAANVEGEQKWQRVLDYAMRLSPDYPDKNPPRISEQVRRAINAAGGLAHIRDCQSEDLPWARKRFIEAYLRYAELERDGNLLPEETLTNLLADGANKKLLPAVTYKTARALGLNYAKERKDSGCDEPDIKRAIRSVAGELRPRPPMRSLDEQKQILRERGLLP